MRLLLPLFFLFSPLCQANDPLLIKEQIIQKQNALNSSLSDEEKSPLYYELALNYFLDQENDLAFLTFLKALDFAPKKETYQIGEEESLLYRQALDEYLNHTTKDPLLLARQLLEKYGEKATQNPDYLYLNFLIATAYANLGDYPNFFERFYKGYPYLHDTFLAYKTQGILYLRLSHHGTTSEERGLFQTQATIYLTQALKQNPQDPALYKVLVFLAKEEKKDPLVVSYLKKMVDNKVEFQRSDIFFYVREALLLGEKEIGQRIIDHAQNLYEQSKAVVAAQEYLNKQR